MCKELELAKKLALIGWLYRHNYISESEYNKCRYELMSHYGLLTFVKK